MSLPPQLYRFKSVHASDKDEGGKQRGKERMQGVRAMSEILHQTDKLNPGDECGVDGRIILHNKRFIFRLIIDS